MSDELPPISALRAFSRVARTFSFKTAAAALHLSPSAVSRQIQTLEAHLGQPVFRRLNPGLELTDAGRRYLIAVDHALGELSTAQRSLLPETNSPLRVSSLESFSARWLIPHLPEFEATHPEIRLEIEATLRYADFDRDPVDVAIRFGTGPWTGLHGEPIVDTEYFPVCSPGLAAGDPPLRSAADLAKHTLIHVSQVADAWRVWLSAVGHPDLQPAREVSYDHVGIALSAAESGQGIALSTHFLCGAELEAGRIVAPIDRRVASRETYHLVCREQSLQDPRVTAFRDWLVETLARRP
jgi:LysR family glycine cleavage system transcriptional activator